MLPVKLRTLLLALVTLAVSSSSTLSALASRVQVKSGEVDAEGRPTYTLGIDPAEGFTMMIATYKRDENLPPLLAHLTTSPPPSLRHIVLIWQNVDVPLPDFLNSIALDAYSTSGVAVTVRQSKKNSMNERFRPLVNWDEEVYTDVVMIMDDDVILTKDALEWGYQEFVEANKYGPGRLVGFTGRDFEAGKKEGQWEYTVKPRKAYSMILSNAAWLKKEWLQRYWDHSEEMTNLRDYVDEVFNCDDILINYLVSNLTGTPPLLLQPKTPLRTIGGDGLWSRGSIPVGDDEDTSKLPPLPPPTEGDDAVPSVSHFQRRKECLARLFSDFSKYAPPASSFKSATAARVRRHYPLIKTSTSISQDVEDHSRWLFRNERWEEPDFSKMVTSPSSAQEADEDEEALTEEEQQEREEFEKMLEGMTEEEIDALMKSLQEMIDEEDEEDEYEEGSLPSDGEEGLGEAPEQLSVFEGSEDEQVILGGARVGHSEDEL
ncbi:hypothetical protein JCM8547_008040 [Rhodosporidiobolus lusitaniae]